MVRRPRSDRLQRRHVLRAGAAFAAAGIAGCVDGRDGEASEGDGGASGGNGEAGGTTNEPATLPTVDAEPTERETSNEGATDVVGRDVEGTEVASTGDAELDLREANVVGVEVAARNGAVEFSVTLYHDDDGVAGCADWWQVETVEGERLGRRELLHAHSTSPFTRSETIEIPDGVACVVVRGHDQTHGYGGQAMLVDAETGVTEAVGQGPESRSFEGADCP